MFARTIMFAAAMAACLNLASAAAQGTTDYVALLAAPDRSAADRATDARRHPLKLLAFIGASRASHPN
jgi:predicted methyltransferase